MIACVLLVVLRMSIGWQFLYEGIWKVNTFRTSKPWTAAGYLKNAVGPFRNVFRAMTGDPDDLDWLDYDKVAADWDAWHQRFLAHHPDLTQVQADALNDLLNGKKEYTSPLKSIPQGVERSLQSSATLKKAIRYDAEKKELVVDGKWHFTQRERDALLRMAPGKEHEDYQKAVKRIFDLQARLGYKERLAASLKGDPERAGLIREDQEGTIDHKQMGKIELYRKLLARYQQERAGMELDFQHEHLKRQWSEIQALRAELVGPVKALDAGLKSDSLKLLNTEQLARGPVPAGSSRMARIDVLTILGLLGLGTLLIFGLASRLAALGAAVMLGSFYLAMPPWPSVIAFDLLPGPEHAFFIDKNMIEIVTLLAIAALPTGSWFGLDRFVWRFCTRRKNNSPA